MHCQKGLSLMLLLYKLIITPKMNEDDIRHLPKTSKPEPPILQAEWMLYTSKKEPHKKGT